MPSATVLSSFPIVQISFEHHVRIFRDIMFGYAESCMKKKIAKRKTLAQHAKDHFIPHKGNGYHPHVLKHHVLLGYSAIIVLLKVLVIAVAVVYPHIDLFAGAITPENIVNLTNQARVAVGLPALHVNAKLASSAQAKAEDMLQNQYFAHTSPSGVSPWYWIGRSGYSYIKSGENLAVHFAQAEDVEAGWIASPGHKKQIMDPDFVDVGVGVVQGTFEDVPTYFVAEHFGEPQTEKVLAANTGTVKVAFEPAASETIAPAEPVVAVKPTVKGAAVNISDKKAVSAVATIGKVPFQLKKESAGKWVGTVTKKELGSQPQTVTVVTKDPEGITSQPASIVVGTNSSPLALYGQQDAPIPQKKLFNVFTSDDVKKTALGFSLSLLVALLGSLLVYLFTKMHTPKRLVIGHALSVIGLIIFLSVV